LSFLVFFRICQSVSTTKQSPHDRSEITLTELYESGFALKAAPKTPGAQNSQEIFPLSAENPHSLQQGTNRGNFTQLQALQNKATSNKVFQRLPIRPKLFHVEQFAFQPKSG